MAARPIDDVLMCGALRCPGTSMPGVSVVIANLNGEQFLASCIDSVLAQLPLPEIVVVDNGSTDSSVEMLVSRYPGVRLIRNRANRGFAEAANQGADAATGEFLLFLNNDARLSATTLSQLSDALRRSPQTAACQPTLVRSDGTLDSAGSMLTRTGFLYHLSPDDWAHDRFGPFRFSLKGACMLVRADVFEQAGRFDESYFAYFEETDLCWRILALGYRLEHVRDATVVHDVGRTTTALFASSHIDYLSFRNRVTTIRKNGDRRFQMQVLPVHAACAILTAAAFALAGKIDNAFAILRALVWHLRPTSKARGTSSGDRRRMSGNELKPLTVRFTARNALDALREYLIRW